MLSIPAPTHSLDRQVQRKVVAEKPSPIMVVLLQTRDNPTEN
jgi:hypothetical protein